MYNFMCVCVIVSAHRSYKFVNFYMLTFVRRRVFRGDLYDQ